MTKLISSIYELTACTVNSAGIFVAPCLQRIDMSYGQSS